MHTGMGEGWGRLREAIGELASGELLLYKEKEKIFFSTKRIYCNYAGYATEWKNFIGYQNVIFYKEIEQLKNIVNFSVSRTRRNGDEKDTRLEEQVNKVIVQACVLYDKVKKTNTGEQLVSVLKEELAGNLPVFYADLLLLKSLLQPRYMDHYLVFGEEKKLLNREDILAVWKTNETSPDGNRTK